MVMSPLGAPNPSSPPPPSTTGLSAGTRLGRYEIISELGTGGMATVYFGRAFGTAGFQRLVAVKYLHPHLLRDAEFVRMFLDEGRLAAQVRHPNVVSVLDLEHTSEGLYLVMEYVEGDQLLGLFKGARALKKRIPFGITLRIGLDVLAGLHAAHELSDDHGNPLRIVHRDISPHNILVGSDGIARITDFGIAKAEERIATTREGVVKGKLSYMAPEAPNGVPVDRRADLFSTATVIWECLTGRRLFPGKTDAEVLKNLLQNPIPRLRDVDPGLPEALDDVLARALDREPDVRYPTAAEFAEAIENAGGALGIASPRAVSQYVREMASQKIGDEHRQRRATATRDLPVYRPSGASPVPPPGVSLPPGVLGSVTDPPSASHSPDDAATVVRNPPRASGVHPVSGPPSVPPAAPALVLSSAPGYPVHAPTVAPPVPEPAPRPSSLPWLVALVVLLGVGSGITIWYFLQRSEPTIAQPARPAPPTRSGGEPTRPVPTVTPIPTNPPPTVEPPTPGSEGVTAVNTQPPPSNEGTQGTTLGVVNVPPSPGTPRRSSTRASSRNVTRPTTTTTTTTTTTPPTTSNGNGLPTAI